MKILIVLDDATDLTFSELGVLRPKARGSPLTSEEAELNENGLVSFGRVAVVRATKV